MIYFLMALIHLIIPALIGLSLYWYTKNHSIFYAVLGVLLPGIILITLFRIPFFKLNSSYYCDLISHLLTKNKKIGKQIIGDLFSYFDIGSPAVECTFTFSDFTNHKPKKIIIPPIIC